ncbi:MAG: protein kinase, partial [Myxococcota bacterium]
MIPFGKYLLLERLAVGGMAEVFLAKSFGIEGFEKIIAIKRILPTMAEDRDFIEMFIDEAKIAGHLNHANIVPIYELGKIGEAHYIAMEYVWGKDLLQIMNRFRKARKMRPFGMVAFRATYRLGAVDDAEPER